MRMLEATNVSVFRWSKGRVGGSFGGAPVILLTTSGHRTGARQTRPLLALDDDGTWIVVGPQVGTVDDPRLVREPARVRALPALRAAAAANAPVLIAPEVEYWGDRRVAVRADVGRE